MSGLNITFSTKLGKIGENHPIRGVRVGCIEELSRYIQSKISYAGGGRKNKQEVEGWRQKCKKKVRTEEHEWEDSNEN